MPDDRRTADCPPLLSVPLSCPRPRRSQEGLGGAARAGLPAAQLAGPSQTAATCTGPGRTQPGRAAGGHPGSLGRQWAASGLWLRPGTVLALCCQLHPDACPRGAPPRAASPTFPKCLLFTLPRALGSGGIGPAHRLPAAPGGEVGPRCGRTRLGTRTPPPEPPASTPESSVHGGQDAKSVGPAAEGDRDVHVQSTGQAPGLTASLILASRQYWPSATAPLPCPCTRPPPAPAAPTRLQATYPDAVGSQLQHLQLM